MPRTSATANLNNQTFASPTFTGQITVPLGTAAAPTIVPTGGGGNDGIYWTNENNFSLSAGGTERLRLDGNGNLTTTGGFAQGATAGGGDTFMLRAAANSWIFSAANVSTTTSRTEINKETTAFSDNVAKAVLTFTVPNAAHSASFKIRVQGSLGAAGAVGARESTQGAEYNVNITRTAGLATVATISAVIGQPAAASVTGAANAATTVALSAISGADSATQTFTANATIARSAGTSDNHTATTTCSLLNSAATGVTVA